MSWTAPNYNGGNAISNYHLYKSVDSNTDYSLHTSTGSPSTLTVTLNSILRGSTYYFKVSAENVIGHSEYSAEITVLAATKPLIPDAPTI